MEDEDIFDVKGEYEEELCAQRRVREGTGYLNPEEEEEEEDHGHTE
jgi:hypothetical protein